VQLTERFCEHLDILLQALDEPEQFKRDLGSALKIIAESNWDRPYESRGHFGHDFSFPINDEFLLIFRIMTDRTAEGKPLKIRFELKTIERFKK